MAIIRLTENDIKNIIKKVINEVNYNYHIGKVDTSKPLVPYYSDNKYQMKGRDTGHFGSGMYFSTYPNKNLNVNSENLNTPEFIQIDNGVYRVDFDMYKNLYRVLNKNHGIVLFNTLQLINNMYNKVTYGDFDSSKFYLTIKKNCKSLDLKVPNYKELLKMMQEHSKSKDTQSMSTVFMEYNGYNGVNVSGIPYFDNTLHGSVIYDLSKISQEDRPVKVNLSQMNGDKVAGNYNDLEKNILDNVDLYGSNIDQLNELPFDKQIMLLKRYDKTIRGSLLKSLNDSVCKRYLIILYNKIQKGHIYDYYEVYSNNYIEKILEFQLYFYVNLEPDNTGGYSMLIKLLNAASWDDDDKRIRGLLSAVNKNLNDNEKKFINNIRKDFDINDETV